MKSITKIKLWAIHVKHKNIKYLVMDIKIFVNMMKNVQKFVRVKIYRGENAFNKFLEAILKEQKLLTKIMKNRKNIGIIKTEEDKPLYEKTNICHICLKEINDKKDKVRDLCHFCQNRS